MGREWDRYDYGTGMKHRIHPLIATQFMQGQATLFTLVSMVMNRSITNNEINYVNKAPLTEKFLGDIKTN